METLTSAPLTFGDEFTLPSTGKSVWRIRDARPPFAHIKPRDGHPDHIATATDQEHFASYSAFGWTVHPHPNAEEILADLRELNVNMHLRTDHKWVQRYKRMLERDTLEEIGQIIGWLSTLTDGTGIPEAPIRAHLAAVSAAVAAGSEPEPGNAVYDTVHAAVLAELDQ